jgi:hypothetical protein
VWLGFLDLVVKMYGQRMIKRREQSPGAKDVVLKRTIFDYNGLMIWLRKGIVHLLAFILLVALLGVALAVGFNRDFSNPNKLEGWLAGSNIYSQIIPNALNNAAVASSQDGSEGSVSLNDPGVKQAAAQAVSPVFIQQSVNNILDSNYAWLKGKTTIPNFSINLTTPKQSFANAIGQLVQTHLATISICSDTQLTQLQLPVDPLSVACRPPTLDPKTESAQVAQDINSGDFLNKSVITAANLSGKSQPYYQRLSKLPQAFRISLKLPYILTVTTLVVILGIMVIAPSRRRGLRRIGSTLVVAGIILIADKFITDWLIKKFEGRVFKQTLNGQLKQPYYSVLNRVISSFTQVELWFGAGFLVLGLIIICYLILTRGRSSAVANIQPVKPAAAEQPTVSNNLGLAQRRPQPQPSLDVMSRPRQQPSKPSQPVSTVPPVRPQKPRPPKRSRLIQ